MSRSYSLKIKRLKKIGK